MNCRTCKFELSQCLDGRLASGRRAKVMEHAAECSECAKFWDELQAAQRLVLRLPGQRVSGDFQERLFERIQSGEGTPEAVFHEPIPVATKVRYLLAGAAAAAVVVVSAGLLKPRTIEPVTTNLAKAPPTEPPAPTRSVGSSQPSQPLAMPSWSAAPWLTSAAQPATPAALATEAAVQLQGRLVNANRYLGKFESERDPVFAREVCSNAIDMARLGSLLLDLRDLNHVSFNRDEVCVELRYVVKTFGDRMLQERRDGAVVQGFVAPALRHVTHLGNLPNEIFVKPSMAPGEQSQQVFDFYWRHRETFEDLLPLECVDPTDPQLGFDFGGQSPAGSFLMIVRKIRPTGGLRISVQQVDLGGAEAAGDADAPAPEPGDTANGRKR